jgi:osmotically-inducible protein OsmY
MKRFLVFLASIISLHLCIACATSTSAPNPLTDSTITASVKTKFAADEKVHASGLHVETYNGVVRLMGYVPSQHIKERALSMVRTTNGVRGVDAELLRIDPSRAR